MANALFVIRSNPPFEKALVVNVKPSTINVGVSPSPSLPAHPLEPMSRVVRSGMSAGVTSSGLALVLLCLWLGGLFIAPAGAQESDPAEVPTAEVPVPAVPVPDDAPSQPDPEWSYRFLVPATLLLGTVAVVGAIIMYFVRVTKNRYRVIR